MGKRVLLIEDEPHIAEAIRYILGRDGWSVASHGDGADALEVIRNEAPDVLVLDVMLPGRTGYEILADLRADPDLAPMPVLVLSAQAPAAAEVLSAPDGMGAARFIPKPFANDEILAALRQMAGT